MNVLMVEPGKAPYETQIGDDLQSMQALVGGYIQAVYPYEEPVALIANESGKLDGLPLNRALRDSDGDIYDIVAGNFFTSSREPVKLPRFSGFIWSTCEQPGRWKTPLDLL